MKGALLVGINDYPGSARLTACVNDAAAVAQLLGSNGDGTPNFSVQLRKNIGTKAELKAAIVNLFQRERDTALFYFSGHGCSNERGGFIVTPDFKNYDEGVSMDELLLIVNQSPVKEKIIIIDCCHSGAFGMPALVGNTSMLGNGVTILAASMPDESAIEVNGHGVFTALLLGALEGGAADITGSITPGSIYNYIDRALSFWHQRPQFKANVSSFSSLRNVEPALSRNIIKNIIHYFDLPDGLCPLDPTYEYTNEEVADAAHVAIFRELQKMQACGLVLPASEEFMYQEAQNSGACKLTLMGRYYWKLIDAGRL